jgi:hypothetical protein
MNQTMTRSFMAVVGAVVVAGLCWERSMQAETQAESKKVLRHVVLFKFKETAPKEQIERVVTEFSALPKKIDTIVDFERGTDVSVEKKSHGFTHGFVVTFRDEAGRDKYLPHPDHQAFVQIVRPIVEDVLVFDYWTER